MNTDARQFELDDAAERFGGLRMLQLTQREIGPRLEGTISRAPPGAIGRATSATGTHERARRGSEARACGRSSAERSHMDSSASSALSLQRARSLPPAASERHGALKPQAHRSRVVEWVIAVTVRVHFGWRPLGMRHGVAHRRRDCLLIKNALGSGGCLGWHRRMPCVHTVPSVAAHRCDRARLGWRRRHAAA